ncbi:MAG: hypothetical protein HQ503_03400 [Rhodospirillales bacterium]|nr:hypothetical protein [Rhodospirillales bacterium]
MDAGGAKEGNTQTGAPTPEDTAAAPSSSPTKKSSPAGEASIRFDWSEPVASAVFRRSGSLWIVFDKSSTIDTNKIATELKGVVTSVSQISTPRGTFLRMVTNEGFNPSVRRDGLAWIYDFKEQPLEPVTALEPIPQPQFTTGPRMFLPIASAGEAIPIRDPEVGDNLLVVPFILLAHGVKDSYQFPQFEVLSSAQGMVIKPNIDDLRVRAMPQGVALTSTGNLVLSSLSAKDAANAKLGGFKTLTRVFKPSVWSKARRLKGNSSLNREWSELFDRVTSVPGNKREGPRLALAQFLMSINFGQEAIGILNTVASDRPTVVSSPEFLLLRGMTNFSIGRMKAAEKDIFDTNLNGTDEAEFWRAVILAGKGAATEAATIFKQKGSIFRSYPRPMKMPLGMIIANTGVAVGDIQFATRYLGVLAQEKPKGTDIDKLALIEGQVNQLSGNFDAAIAAWEEVEKGEHRPSIAQAIVKRAELLLVQKKIDTKEAIEELEKLRFSWRGGQFEFDLLRKLGRSYISIGDFRNGLRTLRQAVTYFRDNPDTAGVTGEMTKAFADLYLNEASNDMQPVRAIALFEEFKELTPPGEQGDEMIRKLADRLAAVDLLDSAAKLLDEQVNFRLKGIEKARVGARLAAVRLLNREPGEAGAALKKSEAPGLPTDLARERRLLAARSLTEINQSAAAIQLLEDDDSRAADLLRTEIYWKNQDWTNSAKFLQRLVQTMGARPGDKLDERQAQTVLNLAVAFALSENERGVVRLRQEYGESMDGTPFEGAFKLISSANSAGLIDYRSVASKVKTVSNFKTFMSSYRERLKAGKLSTVN